MYELAFYTWKLTFWMADGLRSELMILVQNGSTGGLSLQDWGVISSATFALSSLAIVVYQEFLRGSRVSVSADQLGVVRMTNPRKNMILNEILVADLLLDDPSGEAKAIIGRIPELAVPTAAGDRDAVRRIIAERAKVDPIEYNPPVRLFELAIQQFDFGFSFFAPLFFFNSGKKVAHIRSVFLVLQSQTHQDRKWAFSAFVELDPRTLLDRSAHFTDADRVKNIFAGVSLGPGQDCTITPWFVPMVELAGERISTHAMLPDAYDATISAYGRDGKRLVTRSIGVLQLKPDAFVESIKGTDSVHYMRTEADLRDALGL